MEGEREVTREKEEELGGASRSEERRVGKECSW